MALRWVDVSMPLSEQTTVWPGDPPFSLTPVSRVSGGGPCNVSRISLSTHCGTHVDAPWHFKEDGKRLDELDPAVYFGEALLLDLRHLSKIHAEDLGPGPLPPRILLQTRNSDLAVDAPFDEHYVAIEASAAARLVEENVCLVGVDYLSVAPYTQEDQATHHILLEHEVLIVEGLRLRGFPAGVYQFIVLPLPLERADGAPSRAFLGKEDHHEP